MSRLSHRTRWFTTAALIGTVLVGINLVVAQDPNTLPQIGQAPAAAPFAIGQPPVGQPFSISFTGERDAHENKIRELLGQYSKTEKEEERAKLAEGLDKIIAEQFDLRQKERAAELKELEDQLAQLKKLHEKRTSQKETIVRERSRQLLRDAEGLGWNYDTPSRPGRYSNWYGGPRPPTTGLQSK